MPHFYPLSLNLAGKRVLVVGGGRLALQKLHSLAGTEARPLVVAPRVVEEVAAMPGVEIMAREFRARDLEGCAVVFAATDDAALNHRVVQLARDSGILANAVDDPAFCDFYTPAVARRGPVTLAVSSDGRFPGITRAVRELLEAWLPERDDALLAELVALRDQLRASGLAGAERSAALRSLIDQFRDRYLDCRPEVDSLAKPVPLIRSAHTA